MKNKKLMAAALLSSVAVLGMAGSVSAAQIDNPATEGSIEFQSDQVGKLIQPGSPDVEIVVPNTDGKVGKSGALRLQFVPNIKFGKVTSGSGLREYPSKTIEFTKKTDTTAKKFYMPPFLQVGDDREPNKQWKVTVAATNFKQGTDELSNSGMIIRGQKLTNSVFDVTDPTGATTNAATKGATLAGTPAEAKITTTAIEVFAVQTGKSTYLSNASNVFSSSYDIAKADNGTYDVDQDVEGGIVFQKANVDKPDVNKQYTSTITWTLHDAL